MVFMDLSSITFRNFLKIKTKLFLGEGDLLDRIDKVLKIIIYLDVGNLYYIVLAEYIYNTITKYMVFILL